MATILGEPTVHALLDKLELPDEDLKEFMELFESFSTLPTIEAINAHFEEKIKFHKNELERLEIQKEKCINKARLFWGYLKEQQARLLKADINSNPTRTTKRPRKLHP